MVLDFCDNCVDISNPNQEDSDGDGVGDTCDNCQFLYNPMHLNNDGDFAGDLCDQDDDNDGYGMAIIKHYVVIGTGYLCICTLLTNQRWQNETEVKQ